MDEFRIALISIGIFAIVGILAHGMWTIRKNNKSKEEVAPELRDPLREPEIVISDDDPLLGDAHSSETGKFAQDYVDHTSPLQQSDAPEVDPLVGDAPLYDNSDLTLGTEPVARKKVQVSPKPSSTDTATQNQFDQDGIGSVRVVSEAQDAPVEKQKTIQPEVPATVATEHEDNTSHENNDNDDSVPEPPGYLLKKDEPNVRKSIEDMPLIDTSIDIDDSPITEKRSGALKSEHTRTEVVGGNRLGKKAESIAEKAKKLVGLGQEEKAQEPKTGSSVTKPAKKPKPDPNKDQIRLDLEVESEPEVRTNETAPSGEVDPAPESEVLILNVRVPDGKVIQGAALLPALLTLGFKFGEHNMFHRHAASNGKGPRLFTLANMFNPGTFDIDGMENFNTTGVSLFMTLPIDADAHQVFNMMHNAARKLADEFGAQVLDGRRSVLTRQSLQQYVEKIREFERRRMIRRG